MSNNFMKTCYNFGKVIEIKYVWQWFESSHETRKVYEKNKGKGNPGKFPWRKDGEWHESGEVAYWHGTNGWEHEDGYPVDRSELQWTSRLEEMPTGALDISNSAKDLSSFKTTRALLQLSELRAWDTVQVGSPSDRGTQYIDWNFKN